MQSVATARERAAVDDLLGPPASGWDGGERSQRDGHVAFGGLHGARAARNRLLPALWAVQDALGWISPGALNYISERLDVPPAEAYGVATFYSLLATTEQPNRVAHVCDDIACRNGGARELLEALGEREDVKTGPCLGQCERTPAVFLQIAGGPNTVIAPATPEAVAAVLAGGDSAPVTAPASSTPQVVDESADLRILQRVGRVDPASLDDYRSHGGYRALAAALDLGPESVIAEVKRSNLRGRGGAAFPAGVKWEAVAAAEETTRYLVGNADESEPGTFKDRVILEGDPFSIVEAMTVAGYAVGAEKAYLYIRGEYPDGRRAVQHAVDLARVAGLLGPDVLGAGFAFDIEVRRGAGAYVCGEETALFNSIEGFRGEPRQKPPFPTEAGLFGKPTLINNVETLVNVLDIVSGGGEAFARRGTPESTGHKLFCLSGDVARPGVYEVPFGVTLGELLDLAGGVVGDFRVALVGGAAGTFVGDDRLDLPLTIEATRAAGASLGSGVVMAFNRETDFTDLVLRIGGFFRDESCGQCIPCRVGTMRQEESLLRIAHGSGDGEAEILADLAKVMGDASICGLGQAASLAVQSALGLGLIGGIR